jgi:hypothetical protein
VSGIAFGLINLLPLLAHVVAEIYRSQFQTTHYMRAARRSASFHDAL